MADKLNEQQKELLQVVDDALDELLSYLDEKDWRWEVVRESQANIESIDEEKEEGQNDK